MKLSIIIAVLESYEVVRRQLLYFASMDLPRDIEIVIVDDGSAPPIYQYEGISEACRLAGATIKQTGDKRPWSQPCARNKGAVMSHGEYLLFTDIDHVLSKEAIMKAYKGGYDKVVFLREWAVLDKSGQLIQEPELLYLYGLPEKLYEERGLNAGMHSNTFAMPRRVFLDLLNGYDERYCGRYGSDDVDFNKRYGHLCRKLKLVESHVLGGTIYVYPAPREDKKEIFHSIRRVIGRVDREDPICPECGKMYRNCLCYYPKLEYLQKDGEDVS